MPLDTEVTTAPRVGDEGVVVDASACSAHANRGNGDMSDLNFYLGLSSVLFSLGAMGFLVRANLLIQLMCIELMLGASNLALVSFNRWRPDNHDGQVFAFLVIAMAAAEAAIGLAVVINLYRLKNTLNADEVRRLRH